MRHHKNKSLLAALLIMPWLAACSLPTGEARTEIDIAAPPAHVWQVLTATENYGDWNPFLYEVEGTFTPGATVSIQSNSTQFGDMSFSPTILIVEPQKELRWIGDLPVPGLFQGEHYFLLTPTPTGTRLIHGENFRGLLLWVTDLGAIETDFEALNQGLKTEAEARASEARAS